MVNAKFIYSHQKELTNLVNMVSHTTQKDTSAFYSRSVFYNFQIYFAGVIASRPSLFSEPLR